MRRAIQRPVSDYDDQNLKDENQKYNRYEHCALGHVFENIQLILNLPRVEEVKQLEKDEQIEHEGVVPAGPIHMEQGLIIVCLPQILVGSPGNNQAAWEG